MAELIDKWDVASKLISLENEYQFFKGSADALDAEKMYRRICELEIGIGNTPGIELVRCKDCQKHEPCEVRNRVWCKAMGRYMKEDGFCSYGERRTDG